MTEEKEELRVGANVPEIVKNLITLCEREKEPTLATFLPLLRFEGHPYSLKFHYQLEPLYRLRMPRRTVLMTGRQVGKSQGLVSSRILTAGLIPNYHVLMCEPLFQQIRQISNITFRNMVAQSYISKYLINNKCNNSMMLREFTSGSRVHFAYCGTDATRVRGTAGIRQCVFDESVARQELVSRVNLITKKIEQVPVCELKEKNLVLSFAFSDVPRILISVVKRDASFHGRRQCFKVTTEAGREITCTADHLLPTSEGKLRLSEIIEYESERRSKRSRNVGNPVERSDGKSAGGRLPEAPIGRSRSDSLEPQCEAERLRGCQVPAIARVRDAATVRDTESRLRVCLVCLDTEEPWGISLVASDALSEWTREWNGADEGVSGSDRPSDSAGLVVSGRRVEANRRESGDHSHGRICKGGSGASSKLADGEVGCGVTYTGSDPLGVRETLLDTVRSETGLYSALEAGVSLHAGFDAIQDRSADADLSCVRQSDSETAEAMLLGGMREEMEDRPEPSILSGSYRRAQGKSEEVQGGTSGGAVGEKEDLVQELHGINDRGGESGIQGAQKGDGESQTYREPGGARKETGIEKSIPCEPQGRPGVRGGLEGGAPALLRACESRSGEMGKASGGRKSQETGGRGEETPGLLVPREHVFRWDRIARIDYVGEDDVYDIEVEGTHSYILGNGICSYNCDDMEVDVINIVAETMSAVREGGSYLFTGTPKLTDGTLAYYYDKSSMGEIAVKCEHCGKENIASLDQDLMGMIGKHTCVCAKCGKPLDVRKSYYSFRHPERRAEFDGFHISQVTHPLHCTSEAKWREFLIKMETYPSAQFKNECLGEPCDEAVRLITRKDLEKATTGRPNTIEAAMSVRNAYAQTILGVDWGGYGLEGESFTVMAVLGVRPMEENLDVLYIEKIPLGVSTPEQIGKAVSLAMTFGCSIIAHDGTGAGAVKEELLVQEMAGTGITTVPLVYMWAPRQVTLRFMPPAGGRTGYYTLDKTRSLALTLGSIKAKQLLLPTYDSCSALLDDFLALGEDIRKTQNCGEVRLITRMGTHPDDTAHAVNLAANAAWYINQRRPALGSLVQRYEDQPDWVEEDKNTII